MTVMRKPKKSSNFRKPYLSKNKNVNVSTTVISTPLHIGILKSQKEIFYTSIFHKITILFCDRKHYIQDVLEFAGTEYIA